MACIIIMSNKIELMELASLKFNGLYPKDKIACLIAKWTI